MVDWQYACVRKYNIGQGTETNKKVREWVQNLGMRGDDAGHIIGKNQGGSGTTTWNIFPQNANFNRGVYAQEYETVINNAAHLGDVKIWSHLLYEDDDNPRRPTKLQCFVQCPDGSHMNNSVLDPRPFNPREMAVRVPRNYDTSPMKALMQEFDSRRSVDVEDDEDV